MLEKGSIFHNKKLNSIEAELLGIICGVQAAMTYEDDKIIIRADCDPVINMIRSNISGYQKRLTGHLSPSYNGKLKIYPTR